MSSTPWRSIASIVASGGAAPAMQAFTLWVIPSHSSAGALSSRLCTMGAPPKWVTLCSRINARIVAASIFRKHTPVPASAAAARGSTSRCSENRGGPKKDRVARDAAGKNGAKRGEIGSAVMIHHAWGCR